MEDTQVIDFTQNEWDENTEDCNASKRIVGWIKVQETKYELHEGKTILGRDPETCKIVLDDKKTLSKEHASFDVEGSECFIMDLKSRNKTKLGKVKPKHTLKPFVQYALKGGETLQFGNVGATFILNSSLDEQNWSYSRGESSSLLGPSQAPCFDKSVDRSIISPTPQPTSSKIDISKSIGFVPETPVLNKTSKKGVTLVQESPLSQSTPSSSRYAYFMSPPVTSPMFPEEHKIQFRDDEQNAGHSINSKNVNGVNDEGSISDASTDLELDATSKNVDGSNIPFKLNESNDINTQQILSAFENSNNNETQDVIAAFDDSVHNIVSNTKIDCLSKQKEAVIKTDNKNNRESSVSTSNNVNELTLAVEDIFNLPTKPLNQLKIEETSDLLASNSTNLFSQESIQLTPPSLNNTLITSNKLLNLNDTLPVAQVFFSPVKSVPKSFHISDDSLNTNQSFDSKNIEGVDLDSDASESLIDPDPSLAPTQIFDHSKVPRKCKTNEKDNDETDVEYDTSETLKDQDPSLAPTQIFDHSKVPRKCKTDEKDNDETDVESDTSETLMDQDGSLAPTQIFDHSKVPRKCKTDEKDNDETDVEFDTSETLKDQDPSLTPTQIFDHLKVPRKCKTDEKDNDETDVESDTSETLIEQNPSLAPTQIFDHSKVPRKCKTNEKDNDETDVESDTSETLIEQDPSLAPTQIFDHSKVPRKCKTDEKDNDETDVEFDTSETLKDQDPSLAPTQIFDHSKVPRKCKTDEKDNDETDVESDTSETLMDQDPSLAPTQIFDHSKVLKKCKTEKDYSIEADFESDTSETLIEQEPSLAPTQVFDHSKVPRKCKTDEKDNDETDVESDISETLMDQDPSLAPTQIFDHSKVLKKCKTEKDYSIEADFESDTSETLIEQDPSLAPTQVFDHSKVPKKCKTNEKDNDEADVESEKSQTVMDQHSSLAPTQLLDHLSVQEECKSKELPDNTVMEQEPLLLKNNSVITPTSQSEITINTPVTLLNVSMKGPEENLPTKNYSQKDYNSDASTDIEEDDLASENLFGTESSNLSYSCFKVPSQHRYISSEEEDTPIKIVKGSDVNASHERPHLLFDLDSPKMNSSTPRKRIHSPDMNDSYLSSPSRIRSTPVSDIKDISTPRVRNTGTRTSVSNIIDITTPSVIPPDQAHSSMAMRSSSGKTYIHSPIVKSSLGTKSKLSPFIEQSVVNNEQKKTALPLKKENISLSPNETRLAKRTRALRHKKASTSLTKKSCTNTISEETSCFKTNKDPRSSSMDTEESTCTTAILKEVSNSTTSMKAPSLKASKKNLFPKALRSRSPIRKEIPSKLKVAQSEQLSPNEGCSFLGFETNNDMQPSSSLEPMKPIEESVPIITNCSKVPPVVRRSKRSTVASKRMSRPSTSNQNAIPSIESNEENALPLNINISTKYEVVKERKKTVSPIQIRVIRSCVSPDRNTKQNPSPETIKIPTYTLEKQSTTKQYSLRGKKLSKGSNNKPKRSNVPSVDEDISNSTNINSTTSEATTESNQVKPKRASRSDTKKTKVSGKPIMDSSLNNPECNEVAGENENCIHKRVSSGRVRKVPVKFSPSKEQKTLSVDTRNLRKSIPKKDTVKQSATHESLIVSNESVVDPSSSKVSKVPRGRGRKRKTRDSIVENTTITLKKSRTSYRKGSTDSESLLSHDDVSTCDTRSTRSSRNSIRNGVHTDPNSTMNMIQNSILYSPARRQSMASKKPRVLFTSFKDKKDEKIIRDAGGIVVDNVAESNILVTNTVRRTCKLLSSIGKGIPIVGIDWLSATKIAGSFVDPWQYLIVDKESEKKFNFCLKKSLEASKKAKLFTGYSIYVTDNVQPDPFLMKEIIECAGGQYLEMPPKIFAGKLVVVSVDKDKSTWDAFKSLQLPIVSAEFVLSGILKQLILTKQFLLTA